MAKSLSQLLKQRKWTGEEAGQIYLYSTANDIVHTRKGEESKPVVDQDKFNDVTRSFSFNQRESNNYQFFIHLDGCITSVEQLYLYYDESFWRYLETTQLALNQLKICTKTAKNINALNISEIEKSLVTRELLTLEDILNQSHREDPNNRNYTRKILKQGASNIKICLAFFHSMNFVYQQLFEHLSFPEMKSLNVNLTEYEKALDELNTTIGLIIFDEPEKNKEKFLTMCPKIKARNLKPSEQDSKTVKSRLNLAGDKYLTYLDEIQDTILNLGNEILARNGEE